MKIQYLGPAAFLIEGSVKILIDPFLTGNPTAAVSADAVCPDYILVSHGHGDHFGDALEIAKRTGAVIVGANELALFCQAQGANAHPMHIGGEHRFTDDFSVKLTVAIHGSAYDAGSGEYLGLACGFLIRLDGEILYFAGDTALTYDMKAVIGDFNVIDVAMLPIGDNFTMGPQDARIAAKWLNPKKVIPMHYNTFPLIAQDAEKFKADVERECPGIEVICLAPGQTLEQ